MLVQKAGIESFRNVTIKSAPLEGRKQAGFLLFRK